MGPPKASWWICSGSSRTCCGAAGGPTRHPAGLHGWAAGERSPAGTCEGPAWIQLDSGGTPEAAMASQGLRLDFSGASSELQRDPAGRQWNMGWDSGGSSGDRWASVGHEWDANGAAVGSCETPSGTPSRAPILSPVRRAAKPRPSPQLCTALGLHDPRLLEGLLPEAPSPTAAHWGGGGGRQQGPLWSCGRSAAPGPIIYRISLFLFNVQNCTEGGGGSGCRGPSAR